MATIDLGKIKLVWKGAYDNSTAYTPDDVVSSGGASYICILASTGNAVSNGTYWNLLAQGGTDVGTTITTQGDIVYRDGSGLQRLGAGTSGYFLKTQGSGANPVWGEVSGTFKSMNYTIYGQQQVVGGVSNNNSKFSNLAVTVTPQSASSKFLLSATISGETFDSPWDYVFNFIRTVGGSDTDIGDLLHTTTGTGGYQGISAVPTSYAASSVNDDSTPEGATFQVVDAPNTTSAITYVPTFIGNGSNFGLNRCVSTGNENFVSTMYVMEF